MILFDVDGTQVEIGSVWCHLKDEPRATTAPFKLFISSDCVVPAINPHDRKPLDQSWRDFILDDVAELGSFIVEGFLQNLRKLTNVKRQPFEWVIASFDDVSESDEGLTFHGLAEQFSPEAYD